MSESEPRLETALTRLVGVRHPVVQTGMGWVAGPRLVAATAEAGGLGILASATMSYPELAAAITETKARTSAPFGVNLRADAGDAAWAARTPTVAATSAIRRLLVIDTRFQSQHNRRPNRDIGRQR